MDVFNTRSLEMLKINSKVDCFKDQPFSKSSTELPALRKQTGQHYQPVGDRGPLKTYSPLGPHSKHRARLSLSVSTVSLNATKKLKVCAPNKLSSQHLLSFQPSGRSLTCSRCRLDLMLFYVHLGSNCSHLGPDVW